MIESLRYSAYLAKRSLFGFLYRKHYLYPLLSKYLKGDVIDIGCGIGDMLKFNSSVVGVDINPYNIEICKKRGLNADLMEIDILGFEDCSFDSALLDNVLEHIQKPEALIAEIYRVLRPSGLLLIGVPGIKGHNSDLDHKIFYDENALIRLAEKNKFKVTLQFYTPLFKSSWLSRRLKQYCIYSIWVKD